MSTYTKLSKLFLAAAVIPFLVSCSFIKPREDVTVEDEARLIHTTAQAAISLAINEVYDDPAEKVEKATELKGEIDKNVLQGILLSPDATVDSVTIQLLMKKVPPQYGIYLQNVVALFQTYFETPDVGESLGDDNWRRLTALFQGLSDGCQLVIDLHGSS